MVKVTKNAEVVANHTELDKTIEVSHAPVNDARAWVNMSDCLQDSIGSKLRAAYCEIAKKHDRAEAVAYLRTECIQALAGSRPDGQQGDAGRLSYDVPTVTMAFKVFRLVARAVSCSLLMVFFHAESGVPHHEKFGAA